MVVGTLQIGHTVVRVPLGANRDQCRCADGGTNESERRPWGSKLTSKFGNVFGAVPPVCVVRAVTAPRSMRPRLCEDGREVEAVGTGPRTAAGKLPFAS